MAVNGAEKTGFIIVHDLVFLNTEIRQIFNFLCSGYSFHNTHVIALKTILLIFSERPQNIFC